MKDSTKALLAEIIDAAPFLFGALVIVLTVLAICYAAVCNVLAQ